jgi:hypothetical protein
MSRWLFRTQDSSLLVECRVCWGCHETKSLSAFIIESPFCGNRGAYSKHCSQCREHKTADESRRRRHFHPPRNIAVRHLTWVELMTLMERDYRLEKEYYDDLALLNF